jgi:hypothetical protein
LETLDAPPEGEENREDDHERLVETGIVSEEATFSGEAFRRKVIVASCGVGLTYSDTDTNACGCAR